LKISALIRKTRSKTKYIGCVKLAIVCLPSVSKPREIFVHYDLRKTYGDVPVGKWHVQDRFILTANCLFQGMREGQQRSGFTSEFLPQQKQCTSCLWAV